MESLIALQKLHKQASHQAETEKRLASVRAKIGSGREEEESDSDDEDGEKDEEESISLSDLTVSGKEILTLF